MENHKEMTRAFLLLFLFLLLPGFPTNILAKARPSFRAFQHAAPNDSTPECQDDSTETHKAIIDHPDSMDLRPNPDLPPLIPPDNIYRKECSVGNFGGTLSVANSGAAVYSLGIDAPYGGSLMPQVALAYNSQQGGYGLAGYGVGITGLSAITRGGRDLFHDGRLAGVTYTAGDNLFLDGKRLLLQSGASLQDGAVYTVEGDPFTRVVTHGDCTATAATTWFEVTTGTGMAYLYGNTANSRLSYTGKGGQPRIAAWYVGKTTDKYHNYITYQYAASGLGIRPTCITYGTNSAKSRGITNRISFAYRSLGENARPLAIGDRQGKTDMCLSSITTSGDGSLYRKYTLTYDDSSDKSSGKWTRLVRVDVENGDGEKLPPVKLTWNFLPSPAIGTSSISVPTKDARGFVEETDRTYLSADINGDGIGDIIRVSPVKVTTASWPGGGEYDYHTYVYVSRSRVSPSGSVGYDPPLVYTLPASMSIGAIKSMFGGASAMDFDGDGYNDLVFPFQDAATGLWNQADFHIIFGKDIVAGNTAVHVFGVELLSSDKAPLFATLDIDGDATTTLTSYDTSRGVVASETVVGDGGDMSKGVAYSSYQNKAGAWLPPR